MSEYCRKPRAKLLLSYPALLLGICVVFVLFTGFPAGSLQAASQESKESAGNNWCRTDEIFQRELKLNPKLATLACPQFGTCDNPTVRDGQIPGPDDPIMYVCMVIHIVAEWDGSNPVSTDEEANAKVDSLNLDFAPARIQFVHTINHINSGEWRFCADEDEVIDMKMATAIRPDTQLNVWVTGYAEATSWAYLPWSANAQWLSGGVFMSHYHWEPGAHQTFAHEVGHALGLRHTFQGVDGVADPCGDCGEWPGVADADLRGDWCSDTPPTPTEWSCINVPGSSTCGDQLPWGYTMPENFMGYTPQTCRNMFTSQQMGRMRCWTVDTLESWLLPFYISADTVFGEVPVTVTFEANTHKSSPSWTWHFGDGDSSTGDNPVHIYDQPGFYTVTVDMDTPSGDYQREFPGLISVSSDTVSVGHVSAPAGTSTRVDVYAHNYLPLKQITIPFTWAGPLNVVWDSFSTAGLRTDYFETKSQAYNISTKQAMVRLISSTDDSQPYLQPGADNIVSLYFTVLQSTPNLETPIDIATYSAYEMNFKTYAGDYTPVTEAGSIRFRCCEGLTGNVDCDYFGIVDIGDVTEMIRLLFINVGLPFCCQDEADLDFNGAIDIGDLTLLISRLFISVTDPPPCQ